MTERELQLQEAARELGKARIAVALESAAAVARAEAVSVVASDIRETARDKNMKRMIKHCLENLIGRADMKCMIKLPKSLTNASSYNCFQNTRDIRGSAIAMEGMVKFVGVGVGLGVGIGIVCHFFQMFIIIAGVCFIALHYYAEAYYKKRNA